MAGNSYTSLSDVSSGTPTPLMTVEKANAIHTGIGKLPPGDRRLLDGAIDAQTQALNFLNGSFDADAYFAKKMPAEELKQFRERVSDACGHSGATLQNVLDVHLDTRAGGSLRKTLAEMTSHGPTVPKSVLPLTRHALGKFGGAVGGMAAAGLAFAEGASAAEAASEAIPGGNSLLASTQGNYGEAILKGIEEVPGIGGVASELIRSVLHTSGGGKNIEPGMCEGIGSWVADKLLDAVHGEYDPNAPTAPSATAASSINTSQLSTALGKLGEHPPQQQMTEAPTVSHRTPRTPELGI